MCREDSPTKDIPTQKEIPQRPKYGDKKIIGGQEFVYINWNGEDYWVGPGEKRI